MHIAKSYKTLKSEKPGYFRSEIFEHIQGDKAGVHAENKILETVTQLQETENLNRVNIYSDRYTCAFCQELSFRANLVGGKFLNAISEYQTAIRFVDMTHGPLQTGERLEEDVLIPSIAFIKTLNISNKGAACSAYN